MNTLTHLRNPNSHFFAKGTQQSVLLAEYLKLPVTNLEDIGCPKIEQLLGHEKHICNQSSENNLTPRIKVTVTRTGILDCRGKPLLQKLEQITLNDIKIDNLRKFFLQCLTIFTCTMSRLQEFRRSSPLFNLNLEGLQPQLGEIRQIHLHDHQLPAELKELVKTDNVEEKHLVQATIRVAAFFVVKFKSNCDHDKFTK